MEALPSVNTLVCVPVSGLVNAELCTVDVFPLWIEWVDLVGHVFCVNSTIHISPDSAV